MNGSADARKYSQAEFTVCNGMYPAGRHPIRYDKRFGRHAMKTIKAVGRYAMKKMMIAVLSCFLLLVTAAPGISRGYDRRNTQGRHSERPAVNNERHDNGRGPGDRDYRGDRGIPDYRGYGGYRENPYDEHRNYRYHDYHGHRYTYRGHWRSWNQWDRYARRHPEIYRHGRYYREGGHLMFRFCDPLTGNCIFFSIGR